METLVYVLKSAGVLSIFYLIYFAFLRKDTLFQLKRHYLLAGIIVSLLLPLWVFTSVTLIQIPVSESLVTVSESQSYYDTRTEPIFTIDWWLVALVTYSIGVLIFLIRFSKQLFSLLSLLKNNYWELRDNFIYIKVSENISPFSFFKYIVYNEDIHNTDELEMILKHEQTHANQWHSVDIILANIISTLFWFNPFCWLYKKSIEENLEFIADNETVQQIASKKEYQLALVKASAHSVMPALTNQFYQSFIKKRIVMLNKSNSKKFNSWKVVLVLPLLALFLYSFNVQEVIEYQEVEVEAQERALISEEKEIRERAELQEEIELVRDVALQTETEVLEVETAIEEEIANSQLQNVAETYVTPRSNNTFVLAEDVKIKITKNTTDTQLEAYKQSLEEKGVEFNYSGVKRNSSGEITAIKIKYKSGSGNSGNYHVSDNDGIDDFHFESKGGNVQFYTGDSSKRHDRLVQRAGERGERMIVRSHEMEERRDQMQERRVVVRGEMKERRKAMSKRMQAQQKRLEKQQKKLNKKRAKLYNNNGQGATYHFDSNDDHGANVWISDDGTVHKSHGNVEVIVHSDGDHEDGDVNVWTSKDGKIRKFKSGSTFIHEDEDHDEDSDEHHVEVIELKSGKGTRTVQRGDGSTVIIEQNDDGNGFFFLDTDSDTTPYVVMDGKEYIGLLKDLDPNKIREVNVLKGDAAIRKYGDKGKNGVVEITSKK